MGEATDLQTVRVSLGLTQAELAPWLGVSRVQLGHAEASIRPLPVRAWPQLTRLTIGLATADAAPPVAPETAQPTGPLAARVRECRYQVLVLGRELAAMQAKARAMRRRLAVLPPLLASLPAGPEAELHRRWLQRLLDEATDALAAEVGLAPQALLQARQAAYAYEAAALEEKLAELSRTSSVS